MSQNKKLKWHGGLLSYLVASHTQKMSTLSYMLIRSFQAALRHNGSI